MVIQAKICFILVSCFEWQKNVQIKQHANWHGLAGDL